MINIILNGDNTEIPLNTSIEKLLSRLDLSNKRLAIEVNQEILLRSEFSGFTLKDQDKVEIVQAIGGGSD